MPELSRRFRRHPQAPPNRYGLPLQIRQGEKGSPGVEDQFVYVALLPDGSQRTYTPAEFAKQFNWKNDPEKAELLGK